jgi:hypothetical protein
VKLSLILILPFAMASCSDLTPKEQEETAPPPKTEETEESTEVPPQEIIPEPEVNFIDPDTTNELLTDEKKKTVNGPVIPETTEPNAGDDSTIDVDPPKPPEVISPDQD